MFMNQKIQYCWDGSSPETDPWYNAITIRILADFLWVELTRLILHLHKVQRTYNGQKNFENKSKKSKVGGLTLPDASRTPGCDVGMRPATWRTQEGTQWKTQADAITWFSARRPSWCVETDSLSGGVGAIGKLHKWRTPPPHAP